MHELKSVFSHKYGTLVIKEETDVFQRWLTNIDADLDLKVDLLVDVYYKAYNIQITKIQAKQFIKEGLFAK